MSEAVSWLLPLPTSLLHTSLPEHSASSSSPSSLSLCYLFLRADQFPSLQSKMRVVLRVEVEAVKFLKEEPHRLDALLKRCNTMTDALSTLRRYTAPAPPFSC